MSKPTFKAIFIPDKASGGFTGFIEGIPAAVSQGLTFDEAKDNLLYALDVVLRFQNQDDDDEDESSFWKGILKDAIVTDLNIVL